MKHLIISLLLLVSSLAYTQEWASDHIMTVDSTFEFDTTLQVDELSWISGYWVGTGLGGEVEEIWSTPKNGKMYCVFRYDSGEEFVFSEHVTLTSTEKGVSMLVKHFSADFHAWEEKEEYVNFPLIKIMGQKAFFDGCTFERVNNELKIYVSISHDGVVTEELFHYRLKE